MLKVLKVSGVGCSDACSRGAPAQAVEKKRWRVHLL